MAEDLLPILTRFHREVLLPDVKRIVVEAVDALEQRINTRFDDVYGHASNGASRLEGRRGVGGKAWRPYRLRSAT